MSRYHPNYTASPVAKIPASDVENPLSPAISGLLEHLRDLSFSGLSVIASAIAAVVVLSLVFLFILIWPIGIIPMIAQIVYGLMSKTAAQIKDLDDPIKQMPFTVALGVYFIVWVPFALLSLPLFMIGKIGASIVS